MKTKLLLGLTSIAAALAWSLSAAADSATYTPNLVVPDNDLNGVSDSENFTSSIQSITNIQISLDIDGGFNGDLYAFLRHGDTGFAVLLNRVGRTAGNASGSDDIGFSINLSDGAVNDIHGATAGGGILSGAWQPDGRDIGPFNSLDTTARTALLDSFNGMDANGTWTLFMADTSPVGIATLKDWTLDVTGVAVPEPGTASLLALGIMAILACRSRHRPDRG